MTARKSFFVVISRGRIFLALLLGLIIFVIIANSIIFAIFTNNPLDGKNIIIDPGHGGIDGGTNDNSTFFEKDINLQIAAQLRKQLESEKSLVCLTRDKDVSLDNQVNLNVSRHQKDLMARVNQFNSGTYEVFVSIHVNSSLNKNAAGPIVLYSSKLIESKFLAECLQNRLNTHIKSCLENDIEHKALKSDFYILQNSRIPGVIVETGFISNSEEKRLLRDTAYQEKLAKSITEGLKDYFSRVENLKKESKDPLKDKEENVPFNITNDIRFVMGKE